MNRYIISVTGNDDYENSIEVTAPNVEAAIRRGCDALGKFTIEQFSKVEADYLGEAQSCSEGGK